MKPKLWIACLGVCIFFVQVRTARITLANERNPRARNASPASDPKETDESASWEASKMPNVARNEPRSYSRRLDRVPERRTVETPGELEVSVARQDPSMPRSMKSIRNNRKHSETFVVPLVNNGAFSESRRPRILEKNKPTIDVVKLEQDNESNNRGNRQAAVRLNNFRRGRNQAKDADAIDESKIEVYNIDSISGSTERNLNSRSRDSKVEENSTVQRTRGRSRFKVENDGESTSTFSTVRSRQNNQRTRVEPLYERKETESVTPRSRETHRSKTQTTTTIVPTTSTVVGRTRNFRRPTVTPKSRTEPVLVANRRSSTVSEDDNEEMPSNQNAARRISTFNVDRPTRRNFVTETSTEKIEDKKTPIGRGNFRANASKAKKKNEDEVLEAVDENENYPEHFKLLLKANEKTAKPLKISPTQESLSTRGSQKVVNVYNTQSSHALNSVQHVTNKFSKFRSSKYPIPTTEAPADEIKDENDINNDEPNNILDKVTVEIETKNEPTTTKHPKYEYKNKFNSTRYSFRKRKTDAETTTVATTKFSRPIIGRPSFYSRLKTTTDQTDATPLNIKLDLKQSVTSSTTQSDVESLDEETVEHLRSKTRNYLSRYKSTTIPTKKVTVPIKSIQLKGATRRYNPTVMQKKSDVVKENYLLDTYVENRSPSTVIGTTPIAPGKKGYRFSSRYRGPFQRGPPAYQSTLPSVAPTMDSEETNIFPGFEVISFSQPRSTPASDNLITAETSMMYSRAINVETSNHSPSVTVSIFDALAEILTSTPKIPISTPSTNVNEVDQQKTTLDNIIGVSTTEKYANSTSDISDVPPSEITLNVQNDSSSVQVTMATKLVQNSTTNDYMADISQKSTDSNDIITEAPSSTSLTEPITFTTPYTSTSIPKRKPFATLILYSPTKPYSPDEDLKITTVPNVPSTELVKNSIQSTDVISTSSTVDSPITDSIVDKTTSSNLELTTSRLITETTTILDSFLYTTPLINSLMTSSELTTTNAQALLQLNALLDPFFKNSGFSRRAKLLRDIEQIIIDNNIDSISQVRISGSVNSDKLSKPFHDIENDLSTTTIPYQEKIKSDTETTTPSSSSVNDLPSTTNSEIDTTTTNSNISNNSFENTEINNETINKFDDIVETNTMETLKSQVLDTPSIQAIESTTEKKIDTTSTTIVDDIIDNNLNTTNINIISNNSFETRFNSEDNDDIAPIELPFTTENYIITSVAEDITTTTQIATETTVDDIMTSTIPVPEITTPNIISTLSLPQTIVPITPSTTNITSTTPTYQWVPPFPTAWRNNSIVATIKTITENKNVKLPPKKDYYIYAVLPNNTVVRKNPNDNQLEILTEASPYIIFGVLPNNTIIRKFPNGTYVPSVTQRIEVLPIDPRSLRNPNSPVYKNPDLIKPIKNNNVDIQSTNEITTQNPENLQSTITNTQTMAVPDDKDDSIDKGETIESNISSTESNVFNLKTTSKLPDIRNILKVSIAAATKEDSLRPSSTTTTTAIPQILTLDIDPETKMIRTEKPSNENQNAIFKFKPITDDILEIKNNTKDSNIQRVSKNHKNSDKSSTENNINVENIKYTTPRNVDIDIRGGFIDSTTYQSVDYSTKSTVKEDAKENVVLRENINPELIFISNTSPKLTTRYSSTTTKSTPYTTTISTTNAPTTTTPVPTTASTTIRTTIRTTTRSTTTVGTTTKAPSTTMKTTTRSRKTTEKPITFDEDIIHKSPAKIESNIISNSKTSLNPTSQRSTSTTRRRSTTTTTTTEIPSNKQETSTFSVEDDIAFLNSLQNLVTPTPNNKEQSIANKIIALAVERNLAELKNPKLDNNNNNDDLSNELITRISKNLKNPVVDSINEPDPVNKNENLSKITSTLKPDISTHSVEDDIAFLTNLQNLVTPRPQDKEQSIANKIIQLAVERNLNELKLGKTPSTTLKTPKSVQKTKDLKSSENIEVTRQTLTTDNSNIKYKSTDKPETQTHSVEEDIAFLTSLRKLINADSNKAENPLANKIIALAVDKNLAELKNNVTTTTTTTTQKTRGSVRGGKTVNTKNNFNNIVSESQTKEQPTKVPTIEEDIQSFQNDAKLLQNLLAITGQKLPIPEIKTTTTTTTTTTNKPPITTLKDVDLKLLQNLLVDTLDNNAKKPSQKDIRTTTNKAVKSTTEDYSKPSIADDIKSFQQDTKLLETLLKFQGNTQTTAKSKINLTGLTGDRALEALIQAGDTPVDTTSPSLSHSTEYGKTSDAILASLLKEKGIGPTTSHNSLEEQIRLAALLNQVIVTPKPKPRVTTTKRPTPPPRQSRPIIDGLAWLWQQWQETAAGPSGASPTTSSGGGGAFFLGSGPFVGNADEVRDTRQSRPGNRVPLPPPQVVDTEQGPGRGQLVTAAINVTRAFSQFLGAAIQGAAQTFQSVFRSGIRNAGENGFGSG